MLRPLFSLWTSILCVFCRTAESKEKKRPNILIILADDVGTGDIPSYWNSSLVEMPNLSRLSQRGVTFTDAHSTPLCSPSRYMLLSGNYQHRGRNPSGTWYIKGEGNQFKPNQKSIAEVLRDQAGYHTGMFGKWHIGGKIPLKNGGKLNTTHLLSHEGHDWTQPLIDGPQDFGFDSSLISVAGIQRGPYTWFRDGIPVFNPSNITWWRRGDYSTPFGTSTILQWGEGVHDWSSPAYNQIIVNATARFIDNHFDSHADDPFFLYTALGAVHAPQTPPTIYLDGTPVAGEYPTAHMDMLLELDKVIGSLVSLVEKKGRGEDTIIIFTSDNGGIREAKSSPGERGAGHLSSGPLRGHKGDIYEGGHRVPLIIQRSQKYPGNVRRPHMVGLSDIYSTLCDIAGVSVPDGSAQDSVSFAKYIKFGRNMKSLRSSLATWDYKGPYLASESLRWGNLKLIRNFRSDAPAKFELYNLDKDLYETNNIAKRAEYQILRRNMLIKLKKLGPCPDDVKGMFSIKSGGDKAPKQKVTCKWFERKSAYRCKNFLEGDTHCRSACGRHTDVCDRLVETLNSARIK
mmetsp:Transcript_24878/g.38014  ORF Transcript_24878/g.38014 Transcript_24878/m.38014 type:complete len:571 (+) Transcript_24878:65-1777(+)